MITNFEMPRNITARAGQTLGEIKLPEGFTFDDNPATIISGKGGELFTVSYGNKRYIPIIIKILEN